MLTKLSFTQTISKLNSHVNSDWDDISNLLNSLHEYTNPEQPELSKFYETINLSNIAMITFEYGVDGVSIEISKYAKSIENMLQKNGVTIHLIGGNFLGNANALFPERWKRYILPCSNGWSKWAKGKWFKALFLESLPTGSSLSNEIANEILKQSLILAQQLGQYLIEHNIRLIIPVNVMSNPGNMALSIAIIIVSELLQLRVVNSNHDFYWDDGKPASQRRSTERPGARDHFFRNIKNKPFFRLFESIYPYQGKQWVQANINSWQSQHLENRFGFEKDSLFVIPTSVGKMLFAEYDHDDIVSVRTRMAYILSDGRSTPKTIGVDTFLSRLKQWMRSQKPTLLGNVANISVNFGSPDLIYLLQPTRVIARKRIECDVELIFQLLHKGSLYDEFVSNPKKQLILHITGPVPIEHQADLEKILVAFLKIYSKLPESIANRVFLALSVGIEEHPALEKHGLDRMGIREIYQMATAVLFPSESEGRGLPIIEAAAVGIPIICSRYSPEAVFAEVIGADLPTELQIRYTLFPEAEFDSAFLTEVANLLLNPKSYQQTKVHNQNAIRERFSATALSDTFETLFNNFDTMQLNIYQKR